MSRLSPQEREALLFDLLDQLFEEKITTGALLRRLRREVLEMNQTRYAALASVSRRTLSAIENDSGTQSLGSLNRAFRPFGLSVGLLPRDRSTRQRLLTRSSS
ncbi:transcriptional regulator [Salinicola salarius]|uniref:transcriptional regulator n=1 Tax=Salinicola salarius TaxID=430457 RepID=UPI0023E379CB|nr:transcriptional regulator [Salinicola salarius]MDF3918118.1 transcriptional regulator [Salinicola salarius]